MARPWQLGGWNIKHIEHFITALHAKILWHALFIDSAWGKIIRAKYIKVSSIENWFRKGLPSTAGVSNIWNGLLISFNTIARWISWFPGNGRAIRLGLDPLVGGSPSFKFSLELKFHLNANGYFTLAHASGFGSVRGNRWLSASQLGLVGVMADEWSAYTRSLHCANIQLTKSPDRLAWSWDVAHGSVSANLAYNSIFAELCPNNHWWHSAIWKLSLPLKIKCFIWLALSKKILTWDNLCQRGFIGLGWCPLCFL